MGEDSSHAEQSTATLPREESTPTPPAPDAQDAQDLLIPSFSPGSVPSSPIHTLSRLGSKSPTSPTAPGGQISAITVVALLDKLVVMIESVQENQRKMEKKQAELEGAVRMVQGDVTRLAKNHMSTANSVAKLLERSRKTGLNVKEVRERLDRQSSQVKHLEANHAHLLKRNHFKVLIFQEDNEIPSTLLTKDGLASTSQDEIGPSAPTPLTDLNCSQDEGLQTISLSSDDDEEKGATSPLAEGGDDSLDLHEESFPGLGSERVERSRADKFKRSSLKKVDSLKKAFSRSSLEKKINKIVPPEQREKIKKSFIPNHPKSSSSKSSSFRVSPMTFNVKKVRDGDADSSQQPGSSPRNLSPVEVPSIGGPDGELPLAELHSSGEKTNGDDLRSSSTPGSGDGEVFITDEGGDLENGPSATLAEEEVDKEDDDTDGNDENRKEEEEEEKNAKPADEVSVSPPSTAATVELPS
ncbi:serum deprivation-response protein-like [Sinocyclocheilus anshuiensis]|uniref:Serum deprivation-response protein-like n=1 Tax=Sinocyclocheilus anshuiensis TaxID=1608454 RepID=A0A671MEU4_9TELE|nr:PREDICTED: serum deprivation-response protein-like [Sinocyclocheilus anshuiensis]